MESTGKTYFVSKGGGQHFEKCGNKVVIVCNYGFNPSIERTNWDDKFITSLDCNRSTREAFRQALDGVLRELGIAATPAIPA